MIDLFPGKVQAWAATTGLTLAIGAGIGVAGVAAWEHLAPWGLARKLDAAQTERDTARADLRTARQDRAACVDETHRWSAAYDRLDAARQADANAAAAALSARADEQARQCAAAYRSGVTAGRALGDRTDAPSDPAHDAGPGPDRDGGVRDDLREEWRSGAYRPRAGG